MKIILTILMTLSTYCLAQSALPPTLFPVPSTYNDAQFVQLASGTVGASIFYTLDGSTPTCTGHGLVYTNVAYVVVSQTLNAIACASGLLPSSVTSGAYTIVYGCGPPGLSPSQICFNSSVNPVPLVSPIPSWGANPTPTGGNAGNPYAIQLTGNLIGTGITVTPSDFGIPQVRCSDSLMFGGLFWGLADNGEPNLFSPDDSAFIAKVNGGNREIMAFNPITGYCVGVTGTGLPFNNASYTGIIWSHKSPQLIYTLAGTNSSQISSQPIVITCTPIPIAAGTTCSAVLGTPTLLYDFGTPVCLQNAYNGNPTWTLGTGTVSLFTNTADDSMYTLYFADHNVGGQHGRWVVSWKTSYGPSGNCDIWDTESQKYQNNAGVQGIVNITPPALAGDTFNIHDTYSTAGNVYSLTTGAPSGQLTGAYYEQDYVWQVGTANVGHAGYPTPAPINGNSINGTLTSGTFSSAETVTQTTTGASATIVTPTGGTPGFVPGGVVLQVGVITGSPDGTHTWVGGTSGAVFTPKALPALNPTSNYFFAGHFAEGFNFQFGGKNGNQSFYNSPTTGITTFTTPNGAPCNDSHITWNHNVNDNTPATITAQDYFSPANLATLQVAGSPSSCPPPGNLSFAGIPSYYDEYYFNNLGSGFVYRIAHSYNSGWSWSFDIQNGGVAIDSSTGRWHVHLTDGWGQFGSCSPGPAGTCSAQAPKCNIGGFDWLKNDSTDYVTGTGFGSFIMPQSNNNANYIYHVKSCAGGCKSGSVRPTFPQNTTPGTIVVDNTITWETYSSTQNPAVSAINDCRAELMLTKTYQPGTVGPSTNPAPSNLFAVVH